MDRTNWKLGKKNINPLVLGIVHLGVAFPILWTTFTKRGNSNMDERIQLIERFIKIFSVHKIRRIFGDREFISGKWFAFLGYQLNPRQFDIFLCLCLKVEVNQLKASTKEKFNDSRLCCSFKGQKSFCQTCQVWLAVNTKNCQSDRSDQG